MDRMGVARKGRGLHAKKDVTVRKWQVLCLGGWGGKVVWRGRSGRTISEGMVLSALRIMRLSGSKRASLWPHLVAVVTWLARNITCTL